MSASRLFALALTVVLVAGHPADAQTPADDHAAHHPPLEEGSGAEPSGMGGMGGMGGMMDDMMEKMGAPKPRDLYPSLMSLPDLPPEERDRVKRDAHARMVEGAQLMESAMQSMATAARREDFAKMEVVMPDLHEGVARFESGLAANRALAEGRAPRNVALRWFKKEMNLNPAGGAQLHADSTRERNHLLLIGLLALFGLLSLVMYILRLRRAAALVASFTGADNSPDVSKARGAGPDDASEPPEAESGHPAATLPRLPDPGRPVQPSPSFPEMKSRSEPVEKWSGHLKVCRIFDEARDVKTFRLAAQDHVSLPFTYFPGQFLTLSAEIDGKVVRRSYTIASSPTQNHYAAITVKREEHGVFSRFLHDRVQEGDTLEVSAPNGKLTFTGEEHDSIVLIAGGVGITPMMSVIRYLTDIGWHREIFLLFSCRTTSDFMFREELEQLQQRHANLNVYASMTRNDGAIWMGLKGRFTKEIIEHLVPGLAKRRVHLCGPPPMMAAVSEMLTAVGVDSGQIHTEAFGPPAKRGRPNRPKPAAPETFQVTFKRSSKQGTPALEETVLDLADELGVEIDNSCRTGQCGLCKVKLLAGSVTMPVEDALTAAEKQDGVILACQARPDSDVEVDA